MKPIEITIPEDEYIDDVLLNLENIPKNIYLPTRCFTRGAWEYGSRWSSMLTPGTTLVGSMQNTSQILLAKDATRTFNGIPRDDVWIMTYQGTEEAPVVLTGNIHFSGNLADQPRSSIVKAGLRGGGFCDATKALLTVSGLRGSHERQMEAFGISCVGKSGGLKITKAIVCDCEPGYVTAFNFGFTEPFSKQAVKCGSLIAHIPGGWVGCGVNCGIDIDELEVRGAAHGIYNDTDRTADVVIKRAVCLDVAYGVCLKTTPLAAAAEKGGLLICNANFNLRGNEGVARLVELWDSHPNPTLHGPVVISNTTIATNEEVKHFYLWSCAGERLAPVIIANASTKHVKSLNGISINGPGHEISV